MTVHCVIYSQPNCIKCKMTSEKLQKVMRVKHEHLFDKGNDEWSQRKIEKFRDQGYGSFPVVRIYDDETGRRLDDWCDFRPDLIQKYTAIATEDLPETKQLKEHRVTVTVTKEVNILGDPAEPKQVADMALSKLKGDGLSWKVQSVEVIPKQVK